MLESINQICNDSKGNNELYWVFIFSKRIAKLTDDKLDVMEKIETHKKNNQEQLNNIRQTFADKGSLRLTTIKDKTSQSIIYDDIKSVLMSPYRDRGEPRVDSRFVDLNIMKKNQPVRRINNSGSFSKLPV